MNTLSTAVPSSEMNGYDYFVGIHQCFVHFILKDNELATLHGARAFKSFVDKKGSRKPEFLSVVEKLQEEEKSIETRPAAGTPAGASVPPVAVITPSASLTRLL